MAHDLRRGIPYPDGTFDVVYHSHVLEHFTQMDGGKFLKECHRVLKPNGTLRVAVPDLGGIVDLYVKWRDLASQGDPAAQDNYDWMTLELLDQCVRHYGGGEAGKYLVREDIPNEAFIRARIGTFWDVLRKKPSSPSPGMRLLKASIGIFCAPRLLRERIEAWLRFVPGLEAWRVGRFRLSGQPHLWMYDHYSLRRALLAAGFPDAVACSADTSRIPGWCTFLLDADMDGRVYKPDSLFMEAVR